MKYVVEIAGLRMDVTVEGELVSVDGAPNEHARLSDVEGTPVRLVTIGGSGHELGGKSLGGREGLESS